MKWTQATDILKRRWRMMLLMSLVTLPIAIIAMRPAQGDYFVQMRFIVGQPPLESTLDDEQERYYTWVTSEYVVFSISDWVNGTNFTEMLQDGLIAAGHSAEFEDVAEMAGSTSYRSILLIEMTHADRDVLQDAAEAATNIITTLPDVAIPQLELAPPVLFPVDSIPAIESPETTIIEQLRIPLSIVLALTLALTSAFLAERADQTIRSRDGTDALSLPLLGEIPAN